MNSKTKSILWKVFWIFLTFIFLELLLIFSITSLETLAEYKLDINLDIILNELRDTFFNIFSVIGNYWAEKNPLFIIGTVVIFIYTLILHKGNLKKDGWDTEVDNTYHGSSRWAKGHEIFDNQNFIKQSKRQVQSEFLKSLQKGKT